MKFSLFVCFQFNQASKYEPAKSVDHINNIRMQMQVAARTNDFASLNQLIEELPLLIRAKILTDAKDFTYDICNLIAKKSRNVDAWEAVIQASGLSDEGLAKTLLIYPKNGKPSGLQFAFVIGNLKSIKYYTDKCMHLPIKLKVEALNQMSQLNFQKLYIMLVQSKTHDSISSFAEEENYFYGIIKNIINLAKYNKEAYELILSKKYEGGYNLITYMIKNENSIKYVEALMLNDNKNLIFNCLKQVDDNYQSGFDIAFQQKIENKEAWEFAKKFINSKDISYLKIKQEFFNCLSMINFFKLENQALLVEIIEGMSFDKINFAFGGKFNSAQILLIKAIELSNVAIVTCIVKKMDEQSYEEILLNKAFWQSIPVRRCLKHINGCLLFSLCERFALSNGVNLSQEDDLYLIIIKLSTINLKLYQYLNSYSKFLREHSCINYLSIKKEIPYNLLCTYLDQDNVMRINQIMEELRSDKPHYLQVPDAYKTSKLSVSGCTNLAQVDKDLQKLFSGQINYTRQYNDASDPSSYNSTSLRRSISYTDFCFELQALAQRKNQFVENQFMLILEHAFAKVSAAGDFIQKLNHKSKLLNFVKQIQDLVVEGEHQAVSFVNLQVLFAELNNLDFLNTLNNLFFKEFKCPMGSREKSKLTAMYLDLNYKPQPIVKDRITKKAVKSLKKIGALAK